MVPPGELAEQGGDTILGRNHRDATTGVLAFQLGRHHAPAGGGPGPPVDRHHAPGQPAVPQPGQAVEGVVGRRVVGLPGVAEDSRDASEEHQEAQLRAPVERGDQGAGTVHLCPEDPGEALRRLVGQHLVLEHAGAVDHAVDTLPAVVDLPDDPADCLRIADVDAVVPHRGAQWQEGLERGSDLTGGEDPPHRRLHLGRRPDALGQQGLTQRWPVERRRHVGVLGALGRWRPADDLDVAPGGPGEGDGAGGGDAAAAAGEHHHGLGTQADLFDRPQEGAGMGRGSKW